MHYLVLSVTLLLVPIGQSQAPTKTGGGAAESQAQIRTGGGAAQTQAQIRTGGGSVQARVQDKTAGGAVQEQAPAAPKQLLAVRGEIIKVASQSKGFLAITVKPAKDFAEVTVIARENEAVACAAAREGGGADLLGLLAGDDQREDDKITAAELHEGDIVSIIYNPHLRNKALEIYLH